jgi:uncharacterized delta-60 repeat protein
MKPLWIALLPMLLSLTTFRAECAPDDLDPSFGKGGQHVFGDDGYFDFPDVKILQLSNGDIVFTNHYALWRISANAERVDALDVGAACGNPPRPQCAVSVRALARQPDGKWVAGVNTFEPSGKTGVGVARFNPDSSPDLLFGSAGAAVMETTPSLRVVYPIGVAIQGDGGILVAGWSDRVFAFESGLALARFRADGVPDRTFGDNGILRIDRFRPTAFVQTSNGRLVFASDEAIMRLLPDGQVDASFDARDALAGVFIRPHALAEQADGKLVVAGIFANAAPGYFESIVGLIRLDAQGRRDASFGSDGIVSLRIDNDRGVGSVAVALDSRSRIVVAATVMPIQPLVYNGDRIAVARFLPNGEADTLFAGGGLTTLQTPAAMTSRGMAITAADGILIGGDYKDIYSAGWPSPMLVRLHGGEGSVSRRLREGRAIEFHHAGFGHYFIAATQREIATLDSPLFDPSRAWRRTGLSFRVWSENAPDLKAVCRFFSGQSFAPKSSHFYTPYAEECASLRAGSTWTFEGEDFRLGLPTATSSCPAGSAPLYRAYNNGLGGAPNHRYTDDPATLASMLGQGWTFEGDANTKVFACIPPP